ncbi:Hypothetical predicted protein [Podarcis lilfordi]|uniref:Uncharacterized protein n=1 Tax=Podarcis lilfordi TaxID=74358 RepID=A0AA35L5M7_9SAUR|nr:Hypothetical predicted protein [Podarcis lilfordi]
MSSKRRCLGFLFPSDAAKLGCFQTSPSNFFLFQSHSAKDILSPLASSPASIPQPLLHDTHSVWATETFGFLGLIPEGWFSFVCEESLPNPFSVYIPVKKSHHLLGDSLSFTTKAVPSVYEERWSSRLLLF